jgi:hypothetical protein
MAAWTNCGPKYLLNQSALAEALSVDQARRQQSVTRRRKLHEEFEFVGMDLLPGEWEEAAYAAFGQSVVDPIPIVDCGPVAGGEGSGGGGSSLGTANNNTTYMGCDPTAPNAICIDSTSGTPPGVDSSGPPLTNPYYDDPSNGPNTGPFGPLQVGEPSDAPTGLYLKVTRDCFDRANGQRKIDYQIINGGNPESYTVSEQVSDPEFKSTEVGGFHDEIAPAPFGTVGQSYTNTQYFLVYPTNQGMNSAQWAPIQLTSGQIVKFNTIQVTKGATPSQNSIKVNKNSAPDC